jgi:hypothetical protein
MGDSFLPNEENFVVDSGVGSVGGEIVSENIPPDDEKSKPRLVVPPLRPKPPRIGAPDDWVFCVSVRFIENESRVPKPSECEDERGSVKPKLKASGACDCERWLV